MSVVGALVLNPWTIEFGTTAYQESVLRTGSPGELEGVIARLVASGVTELKILAPAYESRIQEIAARYPSRSFTYCKLIELIAPLVQTETPLWPEFSSFSARSDFSIVWCDLKLERNSLHLMAYKATLLPGDRWEYHHQDGLATDARALGYLLQMAENLVDSGNNNIAVFIPELSFTLEVLLEQLGERLQVNLVAHWSPPLLKLMLGI